MLNREVSLGALKSYSLVTTTQSSSRQPTTTSRPEFTPTSRGNQRTTQTTRLTTAFDEDETRHTTIPSSFPTPPAFGERRTVHENPRQTTISSQFDAYQGQVASGRPRQTLYPGSSLDGRRFGNQVGWRFVLKAESVEMAKVLGAHSLQQQRNMTVLVFNPLQTISSYHSTAKAMSPEPPLFLLQDLKTV
jgi:hypothetical protein